MAKIISQNNNRDARPKKILVTGAIPYWNNVTAQLLRRARISCDVLDRFDFIKLFKLCISGRFRKYSVIYQVCAINNWIFTLLLMLLRKPFVVHWIGTDVLSFSKEKTSKGWRNRITRMLVYDRTKIHISDSRYLLDELKQLGIDASVVCLFPERIEADVVPLPKKFTVLSYWPNYAKDYFSADIIYRLARDFPQIEFRILKATGDPTISLDNLKFLGPRDDMENVYAQASVLIRLPKHDSLSAMVLEMLARGRYVIYNKDFPHCHEANGYDDAKKELTEIMKLNEPNYKGSQFVRENFSVSKESQKLKEILEPLLASNRK